MIRNAIAGTLLVILVCALRERLARTSFGEYVLMYADGGP